MVKLLVIGPDPAATSEFAATLRAYGVECDERVLNIPPRVVDSKLSQHPAIPYILAGALRDAYRDGYSHCVIACNTLHLWLPEALRLVGQRSPVVISTIETTAERWSGRAILLCTTPLSKAGLVMRYFDTCYTLGWFTVQRLCQEVIWQAKRGEYCLVARLVRLLERLAGDRPLIAGCSELPLALQTVRHSLHIVDPAEEVARAIGAKHVL